MTAPNPGPNRTAARERARLLGINIGVLLLVAAIVLIVAQLLPALPAPIYPIVFTIVAAILITTGIRNARRGNTEIAHTLGGWAGILTLLLTLTWSSLLGWGGALTSTLLIAITLNLAIAATLRSPIHLAITILTALPWAAIAHLYEIPPIPALILSAIGLFWLTNIQYSHILAITTTLTLPVSLTLLLHPWTHDTIAIDGADIATMAGLILLCSTLAGLTTKKTPDERLWPTTRTTILTALIIQTLAGAIPAISGHLTPTHPWPGLLLGAACALAACALAVHHGTRTGWWTLTAHAALLWGSVLTTLTTPTPWTTLIIAMAYGTLLIRITRHAGADTRTGITALAALAALATATTLITQPAPYTAALILTLIGALIITTALSRGPVPPTGRTDGREVTP
ncbi:hypothetical protein [Dermatophilus congolensis]|uniref:hypothetical protein n=7 Tax=Dermatophilus congolensis TaxID=1863 RepID=UPI00042951D8|nr:hypothetical protein [Dermatophilus congolensis]MBO3130522.1 hypothetical protein [Dermatophilus congolensis]MBO3130848.1 hypothetical protein [Dermatophilus congolensis]MBO3134994.1 hypothetical protein [Dermatophilus congolensis]MBO3137233.1 hypothetical protein [Dermatophilus congolensis]MBO3139478.1 hypothetical protein [Dermatophilus congolensis]